MSESVKKFLLNLQSNICSALENQSDGDNFMTDSWVKGPISGISRVIENGNTFEKGGVNFSHVQGGTLPKAASKLRPELAGAEFEAMGISLVIHPRNPYVPTTHMNVRYIECKPEGMDPVWWFGGGFDLTPYYPYVEDCVHWHKVARNLCAPYGDDVYAKYKDECDKYFYLKHRGECRGIGGLFFDDLNEFGFDGSFAFMQAVGNGFIDAYIPIVQSRKKTKFSDAEKDFQNYRRGRYVEFNLLYDRGTLFGLQSNGRAESILMSLPPVANWKYNWEPENGTEESKLSKFLKPIDWLAKEQEKEYL